MIAISRKCALESGLLRYFTGKPCKHGHICERMVSTRACLICLRARTRKSEKGPQKKAVQARISKSKKSNRPVHTAIANAYKASKLLRTPAWADLVEIKKFYAACPSGYHVDHIIPLQGELVSGLHVHNNLQYLTSSDNCSKHNEFDPCTFENV